jgi:cytochrome P450
MIYTEGAMWKRARTLFNPGFAIGHLMTLVPGIVEDGLNFRQVLSKHADSGEILQIESAARLLAIDVMGRTVLDHPLNTLVSKNELASAFLGAVTVTPKIDNPFALSRINPVLHFKRRYYERKMNKYLEMVLDNRLKARNSAGENALGVKKGRKPVIDLALDEYIAQQKEESHPGRVSQFDKDFKSFAIDQMKTFLLAGHDTTSSALAYTYYLLCHHPAALERLRKEFDDVFGTDSSLTASRISSEPHLVNKLDFTTACIKGIFRFPFCTSHSYSPSLVEVSFKELEVLFDKFGRLSIFLLSLNPPLFTSTSHRPEKHC